MLRRAMACPGFLYGAKIADNFWHRLGRYKPFVTGCAWTLGSIKGTALTKPDNVAMRSGNPSGEQLSFYISQ